MTTSLANIDSLGAQDERIVRFLKRIHVSTYSDFIEVLYEDLNCCVREIQDNAKYNQADAVGEDRITSNIKLILKTMMYNVESQFSRGGNTDLTITSYNHLYKWIAEAKLVSSVDNTHIWGGFEQLTERYTSGTENQGGLLIYIMCENALNVMNSYRDYTKTKTQYKFTHEVCADLPAGGFFSIHKHTASGLDFKVRHIPFVMYYSPVK